LSFIASIKFPWDELLCEMPIEAFTMFAGTHEAPRHYSVAIPKRIG